MGKIRNFLYGQVVISSGLKQFFRCSFFTVKELHDVRVGAVHAGTVLQLIYGIAPSIDAKASLVPFACGKGKGLLLPRRFRLPFIFFYRFHLQRHGRNSLFNLCCGDGNVFLPHIVLNVFFPYFFDLVRHYIEERQLAGIVCLLAPSGHAFPSLSERREDGAMLAALILPAGMFIRSEFQLFSVFNENPSVFLKKNNLVSRSHIEFCADGDRERDLSLGRELGEFHMFASLHSLTSNVFLESRTMAKSTLLFRLAGQKPRCCRGVFRR